mgnify:FL=1
MALHLHLCAAPLACAVCLKQCMHHLFCLPQEQDRWVSIDIGTDTLSCVKPHLWKDLKDKRHRPKHSYRLFALCSARSEHAFGYYTLLTSLVNFAIKFFPEFTHHDLDGPVLLGLTGDNQKVCSLKPRPYK